MSLLSLNDQTVALDAEGFLRDLDDWSPAVAAELARTESIELTQEHWEVITLLRNFYREFQLSPAMRILVKQLGLQLGKEKGSSLYLLQLFPGSPAKIASKIAGLPKPTNCL
ncbi:MAG: tRNA 2-thiouridine synthesizing protein E [Motiliproteus sp.]|jgi:tRNA 2-thiouridine synthesizing protein E